ncbi:hypothetical protein BH09GEM1_BH09GEM1_09820 [soil metagenome]
MDPEHSEEHASVRIFRQQRRENRRTRSNERTSCPPHMKSIRRRKRRHRRPLTQALNADLRNRQPSLNQSRCHSSTGSSFAAPSSACDWTSSFRRRPVGHRVPEIPVELRHCQRRLAKLLAVDHALGDRSGPNCPTNGRCNFEQLANRVRMVRAGIQLRHRPQTVLLPRPQLIEAGTRKSLVKSAGRSRERDAGRGHELCSLASKYSIDHRR